MRLSSLLRIASSTIALGMLASGAVAQPQPTDGSWPSFRGLYASGVADGQDLPDVFAGEEAAHLLWKVEIAGLSHSSPVVWGDRVYVTSAVSSKDAATFRHGLYGDGTASEDRSSHRFTVSAFDKRTGTVLWTKAVHVGVPREKRHIKATYANQTPATDGEVVVAFFGSEGVFALDLDGNLLWHHDVGYLDVGAYDAPTYEWGSASSPILYQDKVIVQCDTQKDDFLLALDKASGEVVWRASRDELPSWGTPTIVPGSNGEPELVTNGSNFIRGYDPKSGEELWRLGGSSQITAPTPIWHQDLIVVASGRRPTRPIYVLRTGARGDITLQAGETANQKIVWSSTGRGPYMPTPLIYRDLLYVLSNQGILDAYELATGEEIYRQRLRHRGGGFSGSPVAADGKLYLPSEDGEILVVKAGPSYELLASNSFDERILSTPALSEGVMYVRGERNLFAISRASY